MVPRLGVVYEKGSLNFKKKKMGKEMGSFLKRSRLEEIA